MGPEGVYRDAEGCIGTLGDAEGWKDVIRQRDVLGRGEMQWDAWRGVCVCIVSLKKDYKYQPGGTKSFKPFFLIPRSHRFQCWQEAALEAVTRGISNFLDPPDWYSQYFYRGCTED